MKIESVQVNYRITGSWEDGKHILTLTTMQYVKHLGASEILQDTQIKESMPHAPDKRQATVLSIHVHNNTVSKYMKQKIRKNRQFYNRSWRFEHIPLRAQYKN